MAFSDPIDEDEGSYILAWHDLGLSIRDIRDLMGLGSHPYGVRSYGGVRAYLLAHERTPNRSVHGPSTDGPATHCDSDLHPKESIPRGGRWNECRRCKNIKAKRARTQRQRGLRERVEALRAMGGEAAEIGEWIAANVRAG